MARKENVGGVYAMLMSVFLIERTLHAACANAGGVWGIER